MGYLVLNDYKSYIQGDYLRQLTQGNDDKRIVEENAAVQAIFQRISGKYDLDVEFTDTLPYDSSKAYSAGARVTVDISTTGFKAWVPSTVYASGDLVINAGKGYSCATGNNDATFMPVNWTLIASQFAIYYAAFPSTCTLLGQPNPATLTQPYAPVFNYTTLYAKGDIVYFKGFTYVAKQPSTVLCHGQLLQYVSYSNEPYNNVFPDDPINNNQGQYWTTKTAYAVPAGTPLTDPLWTKGDNRNQTIKDAMVRITVFKLSPLLAPMNRPDVWLDDYRSMLRELNDAGEGRIPLAMPYKQPATGKRTHYGGFVKNSNNF